MSTKKLQIIGDFSAKDGEDGFSPIANVAKTDDGVVISITDKEGTTTAIVNDGHDGRGIDYIDNPDGDNALWIHYTDGNADVVFLPAGGEIDPGAGGGGGGGIDMTGYAKETWVQEGFQPKGDYLKSAELPTVIDTALLQAKASGEFDGKDGKTPVKGTDYFTEADKQEIAGQAAALVDAKNTCWVHITYNSETGVGTTDKTSEEINAEYNSGKYVVCTAEIDGFPFELVPVFVATPNVLFNCTYDHRNYTLTIRGDVVEFDERTSVVSVNNLKPDVYGRINIPIPEAIDGVSPTVDVSKSGKVTTISITDKNGTKTATVNDGADGADGKDAEGFLRVVLDQETMTADHNAVEITEVVSNGGFAYLVVNSAGEMVKLTRAVGSLATFTRTNFYSLDGEVVIIEEADYTVDVNGQVTVSSAVFSDRGNVKSVNGQTPDKNGNVEITIPDSVDLTGYAKESWVQAGFQPKGSYYTKEEIDTLVENFEPSAFIVTTDGTTADKTNAEMWEAYQKARPTYLLLMADTGAYLAQPVTATATKAVFNSNLGEASVTVTIENGSVSVSVYGYADSEAVELLIGQVSSMVTNKLDASALPTAINTALAQAKASGEFKGDKGDKGDTGATGATGPAGKTPVKGTDYWTPAEQEAMVQDVISALGGTPIFGVVDANNIITLSGDLAEGVYILKYEDADGKVTEIGTLNHTTEVEPTYKNWIEYATTTPNGTDIYNGKGYKENTRWSSSSAAESGATGVYVTGCIPWTKGATVYLKNIRMNKNDTASNVRHICLCTGTTWSSQDISATSDFKPVWDSDGNLTQFTLPNWDNTCFRLNTGYIGLDSILTINEPIN